MTQKIAVKLPFISDLDKERLEGIPGIKCWRGQWQIPWHAAKPFFRTLATINVQPITTDIPDDLVGRREQSDWVDVEQRLRNSEMKTAYIDWATDYQQDSLCFAYLRLGCLLHHPTGSGKTWTAIAWGMLSSAPLVIVTRATTRLQYAHEVERFTACRPFVCKPASDIRKRDKWKTLDEYLLWTHAVERRPVIVLGWESLPFWAAQLKLLPRFSLVFDESQKGKSKKRWEAIPMPDPTDPLWESAKTSVERRGGKVKESIHGDGWVGLVPMQNIAQSAADLAKHARRRLATTATPQPDRVRDWWGQLDLIEPWFWGSYRIFAMRYCAAKPGIYGGLDDRGESNLGELRDRLECVVHRVSTEVARRGLPPKRRQTWYVPPSEQVAPSGGWKRVIKAATARGGSSLLEVRLSMAASAKRRAVIRRVAEHCESGHKIVVFTARRRDCEEIAESLTKLKGTGKPDKVWCGHGGDSQVSRKTMKEEYMAHPGPCVLVGTGEAWGTGVDGLQCTDAAIFALLPWTPGALNQWEGRFTRHGQDRPVTILYPIAEGTADEHLASILLEKLPAVESLAPDASMKGAAEALAGEIEDEDEFAASILSALWAAEEDE